MTIEEQIQKLYALIKDYRRDTRQLKALASELLKKEFVELIAKEGMLNYLRMYESELLKLLINITNKSVLQMTLEEYIYKLRDFAEKNPDAKYLEVVFRSDTMADIWECTHTVYEPKKGNYHNSYNWFIQEKLFDEHLLESTDINAVCVN